MTTLTRALEVEYRRDWLAAFCDLVFSAREYTTMHREGRPCARPFMQLEACARRLCELEAEWEPLGVEPPVKTLNADGAALYAAALVYWTPAGADRSVLLPTADDAMLRKLFVAAKKFWYDREESA